MFLSWGRKRKHRQVPLTTVRPRVEELEPRTLLSAATESLVLGVYRDLQLPAPGSEQLGAWAARLDQGASLVQVVHEIQDTPAYQVHEVRELYRTFLKRNPGRRELDEGTRFLSHGGTWEELRDRVLGSPEYVRAAAAGRTRAS